MKKITEDSVIKICFFLALAVLIIGCDIHTGRFLLETSEDGSGPAIFLIAFGIICAIFYTWMAINSGNATRRTVALICKLVVMATMLLCAFAINSYKREEKAAVNQKAEKIVQGQAEIDLEKQRLEIEKKRAELRQQQAGQLAATVVDVKKKTGSVTLASGILASQKAEPDATPTPEPSPTPDAAAVAAKLEQAGTDYKKEITHWFADFARGPITWFPGAIHGITFSVMVIFIVLTIGGSALEPQQSGNAKQPAGFTPPAQAVPATAKQGSTTVSGGGNTFTPPRQ